MTENTAIIAQLKVNRAFLIEHLNVQTNNVVRNISDDALADIMLIVENIEEIDEQLAHYTTTRTPMKTRIARMLKTHITKKF